MKNEPEKYDDPDPFVIAGIAVTGAAVVLQLFQLKVAIDANKISRSHQQIKNSNPQLDGLEDSVSSFKKELDRLERSIQTSAQNPQQSFSERSFKMTLGPLNIERTEINQYNAHIVKLASTLTQLVANTNQILIICPTDGEKIGEELLKSIPESPNKLNTLIASGATIEEVLDEVRMVFTAMENAISQLRRRN